MSTRRSSQGVRSMHLVALAACTLIFAAQRVNEFGHALLHASAGTTIHDEASHPDAASHLDQEEHLNVDECVACIQGGKRFIRLHRSSGILADSDSIAPVVTEVAACSAEQLSGPPRAPPA